MRQKGSFWNWYKLTGIIKPLKCCQNLYLDHFYDSVKFVPDTSVRVTAYRALSALVFPSVSNSTYPQHSGERYRNNGPLVL